MEQGKKKKRGNKMKHLLRRKMLKNVSFDFRLNSEESEFIPSPTGG